MLIRSRVAGFLNKVYRSKSLIWCRDLVVPRHDNVLIILDGPRGKRLITGKNIVTTAGNIWYAQRAASETPTNIFTTLYLSLSVFSPTPSAATHAGNITEVFTGGDKTHFTGYPKTNDTGDEDNTGDGLSVVSHKFFYGRDDFNKTDVRGISIGVAGTTFGGGSDPLLNARNEAGFDKGATDTLKVFINHTLLGV